MNRKFAIASIMFLPVFFFTVGCASEGTRAKYDDFGVEAHAYADVAAAQSARGAASDATLRPSHFTGDKLNSLGMNKLDSMSKDQEVGVLSVYLEMPEKDPKLAERKSAVAAFLKSRGLRDEQFAVVEGYNPNQHHYSAETIARLSKAETGAEGSAGASGGDTSTGSSTTTVK